MRFRPSAALYMPKPLSLRPQRHPLPHDPALRDYLNAIGSVPLLSPSSERALAVRARAGDRAARNQLVEANLRLVVALAGRYVQYGVPVLDLIQEGNLGLITAADRFDPLRGVAFAVYACWWIRRALSRAVMLQTNTIRVPERVWHARNRLMRARDQVLSSEAREPTDAERLALAKLTQAQLERVRQAPDLLLSLDQELDDDLFTLGDVVGDVVGVEDAVQARLEHAERHEELHTHLQRLSARERLVISKQFGLQGRPQTLRQIAHDLHVSHQRVDELSKRALRKLRTAYEQAGSEPAPATLNLQ